MDAVGPVPPLAVHRLLLVRDRGAAPLMHQLATGLRINRAPDDPAGLIAAEQLRAALAGLESESRAIERAAAAAHVAESALAEISGLLTEAQAVALARANPGGFSPAELDAYQLELDSIIGAVDRIASTTTFAGRKLLDGSATLDAAGASVTIGSASSGDIGEVTHEGVTRHLTDARFGAALAEDPAVAFESARAAGAAIGAILGRLGAFQRATLGPAMRARAVAIENVAAAHSVIRDTDYAAATAALARAIVLRDVAGSVSGLANLQAGAVLNLLGGRM